MNRKSVALRHPHRAAVILVIMAGWLCAGTARAEAPSPADRLQSLASVLTALDEHVPADRYDPAAAAAAIDADATPEAVMQWVAKRTVLVPYQGLLRGIAGSLIDGRVNSLERARLIADLLARRGVEARLVHATLPPASAAKLLAANPPAHPWQAPLDAPTDVVQAIADDPNLGAAYYEQSVRRFRAEASATVTAMKDMTEQETAALLAYGLAASHQPDRRAAALKAVADHWWVEARRGNDWQDLDPSRDQLGDVKLAPAVVAGAPGDALYHKIGIRLIVEFSELGKLRTETVLESTLRPAELGDGRITLMHRPLTAAPANEMTGLLASFAGEWAWLPVLTIGDDEQKGRIFTFGGQILPADDATIDALAGGGHPAEGLGGAMGGLFGGLGGDEAPPAAAVPQRPDEEAGPVRTTAEWIEFTISGPGIATKVERRTIFDLIGPASRAARPAPPALTASRQEDRALALLRTLDLLPMAAIPSAAFQIHVLARDGGLVEAALAAVLAEPDVPPSLEGMPATTPLSLRAFAAERWRNGALGDGTYLDRPGLVMQVHGFMPEGGGELREFAMIDIVANEIGVHPLSARPAFDLALAQGVADTVTEAHILAAPTERDENTALLFRRDLEAKRRWSLITAGGSAPSPLPPDQRLMIEETASRGMTLIVPTSLPDPRIAWWRIDPATGATLGIAATGAGADTAEYGVWALKTLRMGLCILLYGAKVEKAKKAGDTATQNKNAALGLACLYAQGLSAFATGAKVSAYFAGTFNAEANVMALFGEIIAAGLQGYGIYDSL